MSDRLRLADLLGALSHVSDLGYGLPAESALRTCIIGTELARRRGLPEREIADVFYISLLFHIGCSAYSSETTTLFGDDHAVRHAAVEADLTDVRDIFMTLIPHSTRGLAPVERARATVRMATRGRAFGKAHDVASCDAARAIARRIGLPAGVSDGLYDIHEWWNGAGARAQRGEAIATTARIARVASEAVELIALHGAPVVRAGLRRRSGKSLDPAVVELFSSSAGEVVAAAMIGDPRASFLELEPAPVVEIDPRQLPTVSRAFADLTDLRNPFTHGHSAAVARLSAGAARFLCLGTKTVESLEIAGHLHDLGRMGVSNRVWSKPGPLTTAEWEQVRLHAYHSERILSSTPGLEPIAACVGMHHERLDGSGYHRRSRGSEIDTAARILACADAFQAMTQDRPHRDALPAERAREIMISETHGGRWDPDVVTAVLETASLAPPANRRDIHPGGLSDRQIEVLALVAQGCSNPEIGRRLGISRRTAEHHVQHIYSKIGVSTRAAAALFAMEHDLLPPR